MNCEPLFIVGISVFLPLLCLHLFLPISPETQFAREFKVRQGRHTSFLKRDVGKNFARYSSQNCGSTRGIKLSPNKNQLHSCQLVIILLELKNSQDTFSCIMADVGKMVITIPLVINEKLRDRECLTSLSALSSSLIKMIS